MYTKCKQEIQEYAAACAGTITVHNRYQLVVCTPSPEYGIHHDVKRYAFGCFTSGELLDLRVQYQQFE